MSLRIGFHADCVWCWLGKSHQHRRRIPTPEDATRVAEEICDRVDHVTRQMDAQSRVDPSIGSRVVGPPREPPA